MLSSSGGCAFVVSTKSLSLFAMSSSLPIASTTAATLSDCTSSAIEDHLKQAARLSEQDEIRLNEDASRLTNEAKRHRDEAEEMERQAKRRRTEAEDAGRLRKSLEFEALCLALRRNDASITTLPSADKFPDGYAQPLGNALQNNTHVSSMEIQLKNAVPYIFDDETYSESNVRKFASPLAQYMESSKSLKTVDQRGV
jgi:hypothetical protein